MRELKPSTLTNIARMLKVLPALTEDILIGEIRYYNPNGKHELGASKRKTVDELEKYEQKVVAVLRGPNSDTHYLLVSATDLLRGWLPSGEDSVIMRSFCNGVYEDVKVTEIDGILAII